jgi:ElaB/YqjD/DUF883 family membrane-anchored ribosome-binding protein
LNRFIPLEIKESPMETTVRNASSSFPNTDMAGEESLNRGPKASIDKAAMSAHQAVDKAAGTAKPTIDRAAQLAHQAVDRAANAAVPAADWLGDKSEQLRNTQKKMLDDTCNYVSANPLRSVGIAAGIGFLLGRLVR